MEIASFQIKCVCKYGCEGLHYDAFTLKLKMPAETTRLSSVNIPIDEEEWNTMWISASRIRQDREMFAAGGP